MKNNVALVLSGGGARGIAHIGVIEELLKNNYKITSIAGTSMGALVAAYYCMGKLTEFKEFLLSIDKLEIFKLLDFSIGRPGLVKGEKLIKKLNKIAPDTTIESFKIPYVAVATDIVNNKEVVFTSGSIYNAIRASIAIPMFFTPIKTKHGLLVDGGVLNNIPVNHVKRNKSDMVIAVDVNADVPVLDLQKTKKEQDADALVYKLKQKLFNDEVKKLKPKGYAEQIGYFALIEKTIALMTHKMTVQQLEVAKPDILIEIAHETCSTFDFFKAENLIKVGRIAAKSKINS